MIVSGLVPVIISSIERRYNLSSTESGFIVSWFDIVNAIVVIFITHYGHNSHKPRWLAGSMLVLSVGCFIFAMPQLLSGHYTPLFAITGSEVCPVPISGGVVTCASSQKIYYLFFLLAQSFIAFASAPLYTLGITFLDDNVNPQKSSMFVGIFYMFAAVGPAMGFLLGGTFLSQWVDPGVHSGLSADSTQWVGAWWAGFILVGGLACVLSPLLFVFPRQLPGTEWIRKFRAENKSPPSAATPNKLSMVRAIWELLKNTPFLFVQLGCGADSLVAVGVGTFLPKVVQTQFLLSASDSSFLTGVSVIIGAAGGIIVGGVISKRFSPLQNARNMAIFCGLSLLCSVCCLIHCSSINLVGHSEPYPYLNASNAMCNTACNCSELVYKPVCAETGQTFSSVCHAGCASAITTTSFTNCSCLSSLQSIVTDGKCRSGCTLLPLFLVVLLMLMFFTFMYAVPSTICTLRCVHEHQRSLALGIGSVFYRLLGAIPGPLIVGAVLDRSCILWETTVSLQ